jgi:hypothetical protein
MTVKGQGTFSGNQYGNIQGDEVGILGPSCDVQWDFEDTLGFSPFYVDQADELYVGLFGNGFSIQYTVNYRILTPDGKVDPGQQVLVSSSARGLQQFKLQLREGFLLNVVISQAAEGANPIYAYGMLGLMRGALSQANVFGVIAKGLITNSSPLYWPFGPMQNPEDSAGQLTVLAVGNPAAGVDWSTLVPTSARWRVLAATATLTTGVTAGSREVQLVINPGVNDAYETTPTPVQTISLAWRYCWANFGYAPVNTLTAVSAHYDNTQILETNTTIGTVTANIQATDQWSNIRVTYLEWIDHN